MKRVRSPNHEPQSFRSRQSRRPLRVRAYHTPPHGSGGGLCRGPRIGGGRPDQLRRRAAADDGLAGDGRAWRSGGALGGGPGSAWHGRLRGRLGGGGALLGGARDYRLRLRPTGPRPRRRSRRLGRRSLDGPRPARRLRPPSRLPSEGDAGRRRGKHGRGGGDHRLRLADAAGRRPLGSAVPRRLGLERAADHLEPRPLAGRPHRSGPGVDAARLGLSESISPPTTSTGCAPWAAIAT